MLNTEKLGTEKHSLTLLAKILDIFLTVSSASISSQSLGPAKLILQSSRKKLDGCQRNAVLLQKP